MAARRPEPTTLTGDRVLLRPLVASDLDELWRTCGSSEVFAWVWPYRMDDRRAMESFVDRALDDASEGVRVPFAQVDRRTGAVVGSTSFLDLDVENGNVEIGWISRPTISTLAPRVRSLPSVRSEREPCGTRCSGPTARGGTPCTSPSWPGSGQPCRPGFGNDWPTAVLAATEPLALPGSAQAP